MNFRDSIAQLRKVVEAKDLLEGRRLHALLKASGDDGRQIVGNLLSRLYGICGCLEDATFAFDATKERTNVSWNILLTAFAQKGHLQEARRIFDKMPQNDVVNCTAMVSLLASCGRLKEAANLFDSMQERNVVSWNVMMLGYSQNGDLQEAKRIFDWTPNRNLITWNAVAAAYAKSARVAEARAILEKMPQLNVLSWNSVLAGYVALCTATKTSDGCADGILEASSDVFERAPERTIVSFTDMIRVYALSGHLRRARELFEKMPQRDLVAWTSMAMAYAKAGDLQQARCIFGKMPLKDGVAWTAIISAYTQNGYMQDAKASLQELPQQQNTASQNAVIAAHAKSGQNLEALVMFKLMDVEGVQPDAYTFSSIIDACANLPSLDYGKLVHSEIISRGLENDTIVVTSLAHMYARCGMLKTSLELFSKMPNQDAVSWNTVVAAYSRNNETQQAMDIFRSMLNEGFQPSEISFRVVLSACSHEGMSKDAWEIFQSMPDHGVMPTVKHYTCMVDILARAGRLDLAHELINSMPFTPDALEWRTLLSACRVQGNAEQGAVAARRLIQNSPDSTSSPYVLLSHLFRQEKVPA